MYYPTFSWFAEKSAGSLMSPLYVNTFFSLSALNLFLSLILGSLLCLKEDCFELKF